MNDQEKIAIAAATLRQEILQLDDWAKESLAGGWSTHQVKPMQERANQLARIVITLEL
jgi:hypothetical protein